MTVHTPSKYPRHETLVMSVVDGPCFVTGCLSNWFCFSVVLEPLIAPSANRIVHIYLLVQPPPVVHVGTLSHFL